MPNGDCDLRGKTAAAHTPQFLARSASTAAVAGLGSIAKPCLSRAADRPLIASGIQSGDVAANSAVIWARADRPARMLVECSTVESFSTIARAASVDALPDRDFTAKLLIDGLPPGQDIFYRVRLADFDAGLAGETCTGRFRTAPVEQRSVSFVWSGDTAGQGWGIDPARGGYRSYRTMLHNRPDFFIHCGDHIYADCPIERELKLPNGETWRNVVTEEKSVTAQTSNSSAATTNTTGSTKIFAPSMPRCRCLRSGTIMR